MNNQILVLGRGGFQICGSPDEQPPRMHFHRCQHDQPIGSDVPIERAADDLALTLVFANPEAVAALQEALRRTATWFPARDQEPGTAEAAPKPPKSSSPERDPGGPGQQLGAATSAAPDRGAAGADPPATGDPT